MNFLLHLLLQSFLLLLPQTLRLQTFLSLNPHQLHSVPSQDHADERLDLDDAVQTPAEVATCYVPTAEALFVGGEVCVCVCVRGSWNTLNTRAGEVLVAWMIARAHNGYSLYQHIPI